jgi:hypothetical protein
MKNSMTTRSIGLFLAMVLACNWTLSVPPALAQAPGSPFELPGPPEKKEECPATFGPIITDTAVPIEKGKFAVQPTFGLGFIKNNLSPNWRRISPGGNFYSFNMCWKFTYGLLNNLEVYTVIPFIANWADSVHERGPNGERGARFQGFGDLSFTLKYRLVEETEKLPTVSAIFTPTFPTGHYRRLNPGRMGTDLIGGGAYVFTTGFNLSKWVKPFIFYANFWYSLQTAFTTRDENEDGYTVNYRNFPRDFVTVNLAAEYPIIGKWAALLELTSTWDGGRLFGHQANVPPGALLSLSPQLQYLATDKLSLACGVNFDLAGKNTTANITPLISMVYAF